MPVFPPPPFPSNRDVALQLAHDFAPHMGEEYTRQRNFVVTGHPHVSKLSSSLRVRLISEHEIAQIAVEAHGGIEHCQKFVQEVYWRSYWRSWMENRPGVWTNYLAGIETTRHQLTSAQKKRLQQIEHAESGVEPIDNFALELIETGYMHNHARMWFAAFWIHEENLPWELGAHFFYRHLSCACPSTNTLSWRWVAGLQTHGKSYLARRSNIEKYCDSAYLGEENGMEKLESPQAATISDEELLTIHQPQFETQLPQATDNTGIWISEDDLSPETSLLADFRPHHIAVSLMVPPSKSDSCNGLCRQFRREAAKDAAQRARQLWGAEVTEIEADAPAILVEYLHRWAQESGIKTIVALKPFVGLSGDALPALENALEKSGVRLHLLRRPEDAQMLPHANAGFFRFWDRVQKAQKVNTKAKAH